MNLKEKLKNIGWTIAGIIFLLVIAFIPFIFIKGGVWLSVKTYPWLVIIMNFSMVISLFVLSPLSFFKKTRGIAGVGLVYLSYVFGVTLWVWSFLLTYTLWGAIALVIGLFIMGVGVIPIAILATIFNGMWSELGYLILSIVMTFGTRFFGIYIAAKHEEQKELSHGGYSPELNSEEILLNKNLSNYEDSMKICPYCAEKIKSEAIKCKHCGEWLNDEKNEHIDKVLPIQPELNQDKIVQEADKMSTPNRSDDIRKITTNKANAEQIKKRPYICKECGKEMWSLAEVVEFWDEIYCKNCSP